jgi:hypothetical protein
MGALPRHRDNLLLQVWVMVHEQGQAKLTAVARCVADGPGKELSHLPCAPEVDGQHGSQRNDTNGHPGDGFPPCPPDDSTFGFDSDEASVFPPGDSPSP